MRIALLFFVALVFSTEVGKTNSDLMNQEAMSSQAASVSNDHTASQTRSSNSVSNCPLDHVVVDQKCLRKRVICVDGVSVVDDCDECDMETQECTSCVVDADDVCIPRTEVNRRSAPLCDLTDGSKGITLNGLCVAAPADVVATVTAGGNTAEVGATSTVSSSGAFDVSELQAECVYNPFLAYDSTGMVTCNQIMAGITGVTFSVSSMANLRCYVSKESAESVFWSSAQPNGRCDCAFPEVLGSDAACHELSCTPTSSGPGCKTCANPLTRNNECATCHDGYIIHDGDCLENTCTENPDEWSWQGCQECRPQESRRHPNDCLSCAHGYHFLHEQRNTPNQTDTVQYSSGSLVVEFEETGYCFPYNCLAGGNLENANLEDGDFGAPPLAAFYPTQRTIKITPVVSTENGNLDPSIADKALDPETLMFRDHCKTCVPQQKREKDDHCETCNPGYYLDEMHHTCRKKTCGVPHFRRNAVSCTAANLVPKPLSTPCTECEDNSTGDEDACCVLVPPVMTCGAQNVFCAPGTHRDGYDSILCGDCAHYNDACCEPLTCENQQVACRVDQTRLPGSTLCDDCLQGGAECCVDKPDTCGIRNVKCGHRQHNKPADTACSDCVNDGLECCTPITKTCQNMGVFCHPNTHLFHEAGNAVQCTACENYEEECCAPTTCLNQRVACMPGRVHKGDVVCEDCINNTDECCEPLPPVQDTCGNQLVKCRHRLYRPAATTCESTEGTCNDYGETCCVQPTCGNQGVGCSVLQAALAADTPCVSCADGGDECCTNDRTCGLMGVQCKLGGYRSPDTPCVGCNHFDENECCHNVAKTCSNQGVVCWPNTHKAIETGCDNCQHYGGECCDARTCGNQNVGCSRGRTRLGDSIPCTSCHDDSDDCCAPLTRTCAAMAVKCHPGFYNLAQAEIDCGNECINNAAPCCKEWKSTCGNQNVVCSADQTYAAPDTLCDDCVNHGSECCVDVAKTCQNQGVVCRPGHKVDLYVSTVCGEDCINDASPCCKPYVRTCGSENVVCGAGQTYELATTECGLCESNGDECCVDIPTTCSNQKVVCRPGHYADDYVDKPCVGCKNDDDTECCVPFIKTCGNQNVQCNAHQKPQNPQTPCDGDGCNNDSATCCIDVTDTCANQNVVCRAGHYALEYRNTPCAEEGCLNDSQPCCVDFVETCGNQNVKCGPNQTFMAPDTACNGACVNYGAQCCVDVAHTCKNQGVRCRPGYYEPNQMSIQCGNSGCTHHSAPCCTLFEKTCGNQNVVCRAGQDYLVPSTTCDDCMNGEDECCVDIPKTCDNQNVVCRPGHYKSDYLNLPCTDCLNGQGECCDAFQTTCGNQNVKCSDKHTPHDPDTACDGEECTNNSSTCCTPILSTCANQNVVCRPGHYVDNYAQEPCAAFSCLNDAEPCCKPYVKTCANQNVKCANGYLQSVADSDIPCVDCVNYDTKECCEPVIKTCGSHGQDCRQDLYKAQDTVCTTCDVEQCCEPIPLPPVTCANSLHLCNSPSLGKKGFYKPGDTVCPDGVCTDELCCHSFKVTCANQNVQCHGATHKSIDTTCVSCNHYGEECCETYTCADAGVTCDSRYFSKAVNYDDANCENEIGDCDLVNDSLPCCVPLTPQAAAPTCTDKFGIEEMDVEKWPFLVHMAGIKQVACDQSQGYYPILGNDGNMKSNTCGVSSGALFTSCQTNDPSCCWRKTCAGTPGYANGMDSEGHGPTQESYMEVDCGEGYTLKENAGYIVCNGDCHADCCDKIPAPDTCLSARVACSHGFERQSLYQSTECGDECIENSAVCCQPTTCLNVECNDLQNHKAGARCFDCHDEGDECCELKPVADTCSNQRVHCGFGFYKVADYSSPDATCDNCLDDGDECCVPKTCGNDGVSSLVNCGEGFDRKPDDTRCYNCVDDGAECCTPSYVPPTCKNQDVDCGFGFVHIDDLLTECTDCLDNGVECCIQNTCGNTGAVCDAEGLKAKADDTLCTLCMSNTDECCSKEETCWTSKIVCPEDKYHKHPNLICGDSCSEETCCAVKTCENQGVCCNANLGFHQVSNFEDALCESCADNCEECCTFETPTCGNNNVGCGFGYHRKNGVEDTPCDTCALNDAVCCEPRTCGADLDIDEAYNCGEDIFLGADTLCHFCNHDECCKPKIIPPTCLSDNINCGVGMARIPGSNDVVLTTGVQNDPSCCEPMVCEDRATCPDTHTNKGNVLCVGCTVAECCDVIPTCASENVGCGFGMKPTLTDTQECSTCALNDPQCCEQTTCGSEGFMCPSGFLPVEDQGKKCAFCELSECCVPIVPTKTCENQSVGCGLGFHKLDGSDGNPCGTCELNNLNCCGSNTCPVCPEGYSNKETVHTCGLCTTEECCDQIPEPDTCENQQVGCGFGMKELDIDRSVVQCSTCAHNDPMCCEPKTCGADGPVCGEHLMQELPYTEKGAEMPCSDCDLAQCCVPPVIQQTCVNQRVACSGHFDNASDYGEATCESCLHNGEECCTQRTCANKGVQCNRDLFTAVTDYDSRSCMECADNSLECCEPKTCGHHFLDLDGECNPDTHTTDPRNTPCVDCDVSECCTVLPTLKCAEIIIEHGQAFYSQPMGPGSERTKGSVLSVECDLGYKFQSAEYTPSPNLNTPDQNVMIVDYPVCDPILIEDLIEGHVEVFSPTTSGWNRAPPVCRPVSCPPLTVQSEYTPEAVDHYDIGKVVYVDAQMDDVPMRGAGLGPRDYAGEADVVCNAGWIRKPNKCVNEGETGSDRYTENTLEYELKGFWRLEGNTEDVSPHCLASRSGNNLGSCNDGTYVGVENYVDGAIINGEPSQGLRFDGLSQYIEVHDEDNPNWGRWTGNNELNIDSTAWTASLMAYIDVNNNEMDGFLFARYTEDYKEVVSIFLSGGYLGVKYNMQFPLYVSDAPLQLGAWTSIIVRSDGEKLEIWVNGVLRASMYEDERIADTSSGHVYIGADREASGAIGGFFDGLLDEVRYYTRGITDEEIACIAAGKLTCSKAKYYAKPYNTQGCNRASEEIASAEECQEAITQLLQDSVLGNSLNGGKRFGKTIQDDQKEASYDDVPAKCSYREEDAQIIFNPAATGRAHTSLAPICRSNPTGSDLQTLGCLPKCLNNGQWSVALPTCEKDWCNPIFEEWSCCENRVAEKSREYYLNYHKQEKPACPIGYGDCDNDDDCLREGDVYGVCSQQRDLDNIDVCITDLDPCGGVKGATGTMCVVMTAVGMDYHSSAKAGHSNLFLGAAILAFGSFAGYYMMRSKKGDEHRALLEEEL